MKSGAVVVGGVEVLVTVLAALAGVTAAGAVEQEAVLSAAAMAETFGTQCRSCMSTHHDWTSCPTEQNWEPPRCVSDGNCGTARYYTGKIYQWCFSVVPWEEGFCVEDPDELCSRTYLVQGWLLADTKCTENGCVAETGSSCLNCHDYDTWYVVEEDWMPMEHCEGSS